VPLQGYPQSRGPSDPQTSAACPAGAPGSGTAGRRPLDVQSGHPGPVRSGQSVRGLWDS